LERFFREGFRKNMEIPENNVSQPLLTPEKQKIAENGAFDPHTDPVKIRDPDTADEAEPKRRKRGRPKKKRRIERVDAHPACKERGYFLPEGLGYVQGILETSWSTSDKARRLGCSRATVSYHSRKQLGDAARKEFMRVTGMASVSAASKERFALLEGYLKTDEYQFASAAQLRDLLQCDHNIVVSKQTIWLDLLDGGKKFFVRQYAPNFTAENWLQRRTEFASAPATLALQLGQVVFTDESFFRCQDYRRGQYADAVDDVELRVKERWTASCHVFGLIGVGYKRVFLLHNPGHGSGKRGGTTAEDFTKTLEEQPGLIDELRGKCLLLDGARIHTAAHTKKWLQEQGINVIADWPAHSPDLNPIENWWAWLKLKISAEVAKDVRNTQGNREKVFELIKEAVGMTTPDMLQKYAESFFSRLELIRVNGGELVTHRELKKLK
jgi:hypothetical protein